MVLNRLDDAALETLLSRAEEDLQVTLPLDDNARAALKAMADGDGRYLLNLVEDIVSFSDGDVLDPAGLAALVQKLSK